MANYFEIGDRRAMVSLGPLSPKRFCTYACEHCYVHAGFSQYPKLSIDGILDYLEDRRALYDIVYVSGDTDSFAKPRTAQGIELLRRLAFLQCDVLFTTRAPLTSDEVHAISLISERVKKQGNLFIGCVSITRLTSAPHIEPKPIPSPKTRIDVLKRLHDAGILTVLAIRPFLPIIPPDEYALIVEKCSPFVDIVLGEAWYCDADGVLEGRVLGKDIKLSDDFTEKTMDFDKNGRIWKVYLGTEAERAVRKICGDLSIPFFMRSAPAVEYLRSLSY